ncbi:MAG: hypothetical protein WBF46_15955, partial [Candidatus Acidiferrales bacterium]
MKRILLSSLAVILFAASAFARTDGDQTAKSSDSGSATAATAPASSTTKKTPVAQTSSVAPATAATTSATAATADTTAAPLRQQKTESSSANPSPVTQVSTAKLSTSPDETADGAATFSHSDAQMDQGGQSPLYFKIGGAEFSPLGFMDFTSVFRSTDV